MDKKREIEDSLLFCKEIEYYESNESSLQFDDQNYPILKEYIQRENKSDQYKWYKYATARAPLFSEKKKNQSIRKNIFSLFFCLIIAFVLVMFICTFLVTGMQVKGGSMESTLYNGDYLMIDRLTYRIEDPQLFDIAVFRHEDKSLYVKRIIGLPGQTIQILDGQILVDGIVIKESYGNASINDPGIAREAIALGEGEYFVLGDNRNQSTDSRFLSVGLVKRSQMIGRVFYRIYPFHTFGKVE